MADDETTLDQANNDEQLMRTDTGISVGPQDAPGPVTLSEEETLPPIPTTPEETAPDTLEESDEQSNVGRDPSDPDNPPAPTGRGSI